MAIVFAAVCSHSPLLIERVGKTHRRKLGTTLRSFRELERLLYAAKPDTVAIISPHGNTTPDAFSLGAAPDFTASLESFGVFDSSQHWPADIRTIQAIRAADELYRHSPPLRLSSISTLDHGVAIPLLLLSQHLPELRVIPVHTTQLPAQAHWRFGKFLGDQLKSSSRRFAVLASADLSHRLTKRAPGGFSPQASGFDRQLLEYVRRGDAAALVSLPPELVNEVACCGHPSMVTLFGVLDGIRVHFEVLSYEGPFGVGHLIAHANFAPDSAAPDQTAV